jgi:hypothetical protein
MENIKAEAPAAPTAPTAPTAPAATKTEVPAPGTPEFAAWAWENRNG